MFLRINFLATHSRVATLDSLLACGRFKGGLGSTSPSEKNPIRDEMRFRGRFGLSLVGSGGVLDASEVADPSAVALGVDFTACSRLSPAGLGC